MKLKAIYVNGLRFTCYVHGHGPRLLILMHGFPDDAASMLPLLERLADEARYTIVAPYLRGYGPTSRAHDGQYMLETLGKDVTGLMDAFEFERATVIGHDWGAMCGYAAASQSPERVELLVAMSVPPPSCFLRGLLKHPSQLYRSRYMFLFQIPGLAEWALQYNEFALVEALWRQWSPNWQFAPSRLAKVKTTLGHKHTPRGALKYYRGLLADAFVDPERWRESLNIVLMPLRVPTIVVSGDDDGCIAPEMFENMDGVFESDWHHVQLAGCGHFPQHEALDRLVDVVQKGLDRELP